MTPTPLRALTLAATAALCLLHGTAHALSDTDFLSANRTFLAASAGDAGALDTAAAAFDVLQKAEPANPVPLAYAGALESMRARGTVLPWKKISHAEDGLAAIDKALAMLTPAHDAERVAGTPPALLVKFTAANTFLAMPSFMNRAARGRKLLDEVLAHPAYPSTPAPFRDAVQRTVAQQAAAQAAATRSAP